MFWDAFIWGLGATAGGSIGLMLFVVLWSIWAVITKRTKAAKRLEEMQQIANAALTRRNELTEETNRKLKDIHEALYYGENWNEQ